ncbi:hypothetical protein V494_04862 [Pseudogymnoascus sp. VKM F-4513 (FW-928)]|nr:hypothetical protein V494_04862 [Pseudogymnoascus sp. VKM F-4513 (FW-928)]
MSANTTVGNVRQRATLACDMCRSRRTKCDMRKPTCSFCDEHGIVCNYRVPPAPGPSKNDLEIQAIRDRLEDLCGLVSMRRLDPNYVFPGGSSSPNPTSFDQYPAAESIISRNWRMEFPFMTIQTPSTMCLLGQDPKLAAQMVSIERTKVDMLTPPVVSAGFKFQYDNAVRAFGFFYDRIHHWYPILHEEFFGLYLGNIAGDFSPCPDSCLVLLVAAIGSVCQFSSRATAYEKRPDVDYIGKALTVLPDVHFEFSLRSVQCLVLLAVYYNCIGKPCQAHDYILMASCKAQALFKCELGYHIDMPESNIWKFDDRILFPGIHGSWEPFQESNRYLFDQIRPSNTSSLSPNDTKAYFLAAISMCRMMRRCFAAVTVTNNKEVYAPIIAAELLYQLENWHDRLPTSLSFHRQGPHPIAFDDTLSYTTPPSYSSQAAARVFLQMQFYQCLVSTYWPAVYSVMYLDVAPAATQFDCSRFFNALFITTMAAHKGAGAICLQDTISPEVKNCFEIATKIFDEAVVATSPSLAILGAILSQQVGAKSGGPN